MADNEEKGFFQRWLAKRKNNEEDDKKTQIQKLIEYLNGNSRYDDQEEAIEFLEKIDAPDGIVTFCDEDILCEVVYKIVEKEADFKSSIADAKKIYDIVIYDAGDEEQKQLYFKLFDLYLRNHESLYGCEDFSSVFSMFENKKLVYSYYKFLVDSRLSDTESQLILRYVKQARQFYVDENGFYSAIIELAEKVIKVSPSSRSIERCIDAAITKDKQIAGIYSVDEDLIRELSQTVEECANTMDVCSRKRTELLSGYEDIANKAGDISKSLAEEVPTIVNRIMQEKEKELARRCEDALSKIDTLLNKAGSTSKSQLEEIKKVGIKYLTLINERVGAKEEVLQNITSIISTFPTSELLDSKKSFTERLNKALKKKDGKELYHSTFDSILKQVILNKPVMLVGPSGSGKSCTIEQMAELLDVRMYNFGFVTDEITAIKGYNDINGNFVKTPFYEMYKNGGLCFFDEIDNSESKALIELNKIIGPKGFKEYLFPNGDLIEPHPNFRIVAAANTWGDGADSLHTTRERLDGATVNRFASIEYDYDSTLEQKIMGKYTEMYEFITALRRVVSKKGLDFIISTRDMSDAKDYLDAKEFTLGEIIKIKIIKNQRIETLRSIYSEIEDILSSSNPVLKAFEAEIANCVKVRTK